MSTTIKVNPDYFTKEKTQKFLKDHELACQTMEVDDFALLFLKYDLSYIDDYNEVLTAIGEIMMDWKKEFRGTELQEVTTFDSNCIFCTIGKKVKVYRWSCLHTKASSPTNKLLDYNQIAFMFDIKDGCLVNYGTCNAYLEDNELQKTLE
jgi:hypothetical protein